MKLLIEQQFEDVRVIEEEINGVKNMYVEGIYIQAEKQNGNGRIYRKNWIKPEIDRYITERVNKNRAWGELGHPTTGNPTQIDHNRVSHRIVSLQEDRNNWIGKSIVTNTPAGNIVRGLFECGGVLGTSTRGLGSLKQISELQEVQNDYRLVTAGDIVDENSAPDATLRALVENHEWIYNVNTGDWQAQELVEQMVKETKQLTKAQMEEQKIRLFEKFINTLIK